jgi:ribonuclease HII
MPEDILGGGMICYSAAGVDEAGRGCLAGPVVAACVMLPEGLDTSPFKDSKQLSATKRDELYTLLFESTPMIGVGIVSHQEIDRINILQATLLAMKIAIGHLSILPTEILVDGNKTPELDNNLPISAIIKGDATVPAISAASIVAKVTRDRLMDEMHLAFPQYGFNQNKGYGSEAHYEAIFLHGPCPIHRLSFNLTRQEQLF